jgi:sugar phosphate isomerase/epimerase
MHRRHFLKKTTLAALALQCDTGLSPVVLPTASAASQASPLRLGFNTYGTQSLPTAEAIKAIAAAGFDAIELALMPGWDTDPTTLTKQHKTDLRKQLADSGLHLTALQEHLDDVTKEEVDQSSTLERLRRAIDLAHFLGPDNPPLIESALGGKLGWERTHDLLLERLPAWQSLAEENKTVVAIKPHRGKGMTRPEHGIEVIKKLGDSPWLRINWDYSHYIFRDPPLPLVETIKKSVSHTALITVKDTYLDNEDNNKARFALPGVTGNIDYPALFKTFYDSGYRGDVQCEVSAQLWKQSGYDPKAAITTCYKNMSQALLK